jgi:hypothetical protein
MGRRVEQRKVEEAAWAAKAGPVISTWSLMAYEPCWVIECENPATYGVRARKNNFGAQLSTCSQHLPEATEVVTGRVVAG